MEHLPVFDLFHVAVSLAYSLCTFQKFGFDSLDIFVSTDCFFVTKLMIYTCPEIHSDRADLDFGAHWNFSLCKENRDLNDHMIASITVWLWCFYVVFNLKNGNVIL